MSWTCRVHHPAAATLDTIGEQPLAAGVIDPGPQVAHEAVLEVDVDLDLGRGSVVGGVERGRGVRLIEQGDGRVRVDHDWGRTGRVFCTDSSGVTAWPAPEPRRVVASSY
jgi:hypothetical protein